MEEQQYIVFVEKTGEDEKDNIFYRLLFSNNPDVVWGDNFNVTPAGIIPDLEPDPSTITKEFQLKTKEHLSTAVESTWFSLQDCIDGIIALLFNGEGDNVVVIPFGMEMEKVLEILEGIGGEMTEVEYKPKNKETDES